MWSRLRATGRTISFVRYVQVFPESTATTLKSIILADYSVHVRIIYVSVKGLL